MRDCCCTTDLLIVGGAFILILPRGSRMEDVLAPTAVPVEYEGEGDWITPDRSEIILAEVDNETLGSLLGHAPGR